jgi:hypothetical protein
VLLSVYKSGHDIPTGFAGIGQQIPQSDLAARAGATGITSVVEFIASALVTAACIKAVSDGYLDQTASVSGSLRFAARRLLPLLGLLILVALGEVIGIVLLVVPGVYLYASWAVATPSLLIERQGPLGALRRSHRLVKGRWWPTAGVLLLASVVVALIGGALTALLSALALQSNNPSVLFAVTITTLAGIVSQIIVQPFTATVTTVLYFDLRIRHEAFDLTVMVDQLGLPEATLPPSALPLGSPGGFGPEDVGKPGGPPFWPPPPGWQPGR